MKRLFLLIALLVTSIVGAFAQNSITWNQDGKKCTVNLYTGDFSITIYDDAGNEYIVYGPDYDFDVNARNGNIYYSNGRVSGIGSTSIYYSNGRVSSIGILGIYYSNGRVSSIGNMGVYYSNGKLSSIGTTGVYYSNGRVSSVGSASVYYSNGRVSSISGNVR